MFWKPRFLAAALCFQQTSCDEIPWKLTAKDHMDNYPVAGPSSSILKAQTSFFF